MNSAGSRRAKFAAKAATAVCLVLAILASLAIAQKKSPPSSPIDLNAASAEQLQQIPGIGPSTAQAIVKMREKSGRFHRVEDLLAIHGISPARLDKIRPYVYVGSPLAPK